MSYHKGWHKGHVLEWNGGTPPLKKKQEEAKTRRRVLKSILVVQLAASGCEPRAVLVMKVGPSLTQKPFFAA